MVTLRIEIVSVLAKKEERRTSTPVAPPRKDQPSCWKNSKGFSLICFMMGPQFKLTGPSLIGISTELPYISMLGRIQLWHLLQPVLDVVHLRTLNWIDM